MKKSLLFSACALGLGLFSCTQEEGIDSQVENGGPVTVSVALPGSGSRSVPAAPEGYELRCKLQVVYTDGTPSDTYAELAGDAEANIEFKFQPKSSDYNCLFWADYVPEVSEGAAAEAVPDKFYNTTDLRNVTYTETARTDGSLFDSNACDAFCGWKDAQSIMDNDNHVSVTLTRPFMKLSINDKNQIEAEKLKVEIQALPSGFNVLNNTCASTAAITKPEAAFVAGEENCWFSTYMFAPVDMTEFDAKNITMTVTYPEGSDYNPKQVIKTLQGTIHVGTNTTYEGNIDFNLPNVTVDVDIDENPAKVGDYYYSDGTWSTELDEVKTVIGVVFATPSAGAGSDAVGNYADVSLERIRGWVVSLKEVSPTPRFVNTSDGTAGANIEGIEGVGTGENDIKGYANKAAWKSNTLSNGATYVALTAVESYAENYSAPLPEAGTSGWYIPAVGQLLTLRTAYNAEGSKVKAALQTLNSDGEKADMFTTGTGGPAYYWSSSAAVRREVNNVTLVGFDVTIENPVSYSTGNAGRHLRPVLTF